MELKGKKIIIIGERDGVQGSAISECLESAGAKPVLVFTECFVWTSAGALDPEGQEKIKKFIERNGKDNVIVIIGAPDADSAELYAETLTRGDPTWVGPLAGLALHLPVFHILEPDIKKQVDTQLYNKHLAIMETALDVERIAQGLKKVRETES